MQEVIGSIPFTSTKIVEKVQVFVAGFKKACVGSSKVKTPSSRGLGHYPFTVGTGVRIPVGSPDFFAAVQRETAQGCQALGSQEQTLSYQEW